MWVEHEAQNGGAILLTEGFNDALRSAVRAPVLQTVGRWFGPSRAHFSSARTAAVSMAGPRVFLAIPHPFPHQQQPGSAQGQVGGISASPVWKRKEGGEAIENGRLSQMGFDGLISAAAFPAAPTFRPVTNPRRFETAETLRIGEGGNG